MELSISIARVVALVYLAAGIGAIFNADHYRRLADDFFNNAALTYVSGFMTVIVGFLIVHYHNVWVSHWPVLITIIGWLALVKGLLLIAFPKFVQGYSRLFFAGRGFRIFPYIALFMGLLFGYFGFFS